MTRVAREAAALAATDARAALTSPVDAPASTRRPSAGASSPDASTGRAAARVQGAGAQRSEINRHATTSESLGGAGAPSVLESEGLTGPAPADLNRAAWLRKVETLDEPRRRRREERFRTKSRAAADRAVELRDVLDARADAERAALVVLSSDEPNAESGARVRAELVDALEAERRARSASLLEFGSDDLRGVVEALDRTAKWHGDRARAAPEQFDRVRACGTGTLHLRCACGHHALTIPQRCGVGRLCVSCRDADKRAAQEAFGRARLVALDHARRAHLLDEDRFDRWSEKFLTLTMPHVGSVIDRVRIVTRAWRRFSRLLQKHWREERTRRSRRASPLQRWRERFQPKPSYYRAFEWTPGDDGQGHPHLHVWLLCPYLHVERLHAWWIEALEWADLPAEHAQRATIPVVKRVATRGDEFRRELLKGAKGLRLAARFVTRGRDGGDDVIDYAVGWSVAELGDDGELVEPAVAADLLAALETTRFRQGSSGFLSAPPHPELASELARDELACAHCGVGLALAFVEESPTRRRVALEQLRAAHASGALDQPRSPP